MLVGQTAKTQKHETFNAIARLSPVFLNLPPKSLAGQEELGEHKTDSGRREGPRWPKTYAAWILAQQKDKTEQLTLHAPKKKGAPHPSWQAQITAASRGLRSLLCSSQHSAISTTGESPSNTILLAETWRGKKRMRRAWGRTLT